MKITAVRARRVTGTMEYEGEFREDRQARPIDLLADMVTVAGGGPRRRRSARVATAWRRSSWRSRRTRA